MRTGRGSPPGRSTRTPHPHGAAAPGRRAGRSGTRRPVRRRRRRGRCPRRTPRPLRRGRPRRRPPEESPHGAPTRESAAHRAEQRRRPRGRPRWWCAGLLRDLGRRSPVKGIRVYDAPVAGTFRRRARAVCGAFSRGIPGSPGRFPSGCSRGGYPGAPAGGQWMIPVRSATATMPARSPVPSLRAIRARWDLTVRADRPIETPMALLDWPSATRRRTSTSRPESSR